MPVKPPHAGKLSVQEDPPLQTGRTAVVAAISFALLLVAIGYQAGKKSAHPPILAGIYELQQVQQAAFPRAIATEHDWEADWETLFPERKAGTSTTSFSLSVADTPSARFARSLINEYTLLQQSGYTPEAADQLGEALAEDLYGVVLYEPYTDESIQTTSNTSYEGTLRYRAEMQDALKPLLAIPEPEFAMFARIIENDSSEAAQDLFDSADIHDSVARALMQIVVPQDAVPIHLGVVNALAYFSATLKEMVRNSYDPFATLSFLKTYNDAENYVIYAFDTLSSYYQQKYMSRPIDTEGPSL